MQVHIAGGLVEELRTIEGAAAGHIVRAAHVLGGEGEEATGEQRVVCGAIVPEVVEIERVRSGATGGDAEHVGGERRVVQHARQPERIRYQPGAGVRGAWIGGGWCGRRGWGGCRIIVLLAGGKGQYGGEGEEKEGAEVGG